MDQLFGLPAHPLVVHLPVVLLPLAAIGAIATVIRPSWYLRYRWLVVAVAGVGMLGAVLAASSGEELEHEVARSASDAARRAIHDHAEAGDVARTMSIVFFVVILAYALVPWWLARRDDGDSDGEGSSGAPAWLRPVLAVAVVLASLGTVWTVIDAGHSGADSVWSELDEGSG